MSFYKFNMKLRRGDEEKEVDVYQIGLTPEQATKYVNRIRLWKGTDVSQEILNIEEIDEYEFIIGIIRNPLYCESEIGQNMVYPLKWVEKKMSFGKRAFKTEDGKQLVAFCINCQMLKECFGENLETYENNQKILEREYTNWAENFIIKSSVENVCLNR